MSAGVHASARTTDFLPCSYRVTSISDYGPFASHIGQHVHSKQTRGRFLIRKVAESPMKRPQLRTETGTSTVRDSYTCRTLCLSTVLIR
eukprot:scaffold116939_cov34-Prasinocladus_malaysianus.AAC.1